MSDIPAGWYDNPEAPSQHRYWDGTAWTQHTAPKAPPRPPNGSGSVWQAVSEMFSLVGSCWRSLVLVVAPLTMLAIAGMAALYVGFEAALSPGLDEIIERLTSGDFDPDNNLSDDRFLDSIEFDVGASSVMAWILGGAAFLVGAVLQTVVVTIHLASAAAGRPLGVGGTYAAAVRRLPRIIGISLLWTLGGLLGFVVLAVVIGVAIAAPLLFLVVVPALIGLLIFVWPYATVAATKLAVGPISEPPLRGAIRFVNGRWGSLAVRMLVIQVVLWAIGLAINTVTGPLGAVSIAAAVLASLLFQAVQSVMAAAGNVVVYHWGGGEYDEGVLAPVSADTPPL